MSRNLQLRARHVYPATASAYAVVLWTCLILLTSLAGCASPGGGGTDGARDLVTESDEPEARRRARIRLELASNYFDQGQVTVALDEVKQALAADPNFADAYNLRGLIYQRLRDPQQAEESFRRALALNPRDSDTMHNYGVMLCELRRYPEAEGLFARALANPLYGGRPKSLMMQGLCQARAGRRADAEQTLTRAYELDPANPVTGFNLALLKFDRGDFVRAQFYIRRINNSDLANAQSLWLGAKIENRLNNPVAVDQLGDQLRRRFPQSREAAAFARRAFDE